MDNQFPYTPTATKIIGEAPDGNTSTLIYIDEVEQYVPDGSYEPFIRVSVKNPTKPHRDTFYFDTERFRVSFNAIQSNEDSMELLTLYMMAIQGNYDLNKFVIKVARKLERDFGFEEIRMMENKV